jgi:hypothetical protein
MATIGIRASLPDSQQLCSAAADLAKKLQLPDAQHQPERFDMLLVVADHHLELHWQGAAEGGDDDAAAAPPGRKLNPVCIDLEQIDGLSPWGRSLRQPLARAMGITKGNRYRPMILDDRANRSRRRGRRGAPRGPQAKRDALKELALVAQGNRPGRTSTDRA